jgi:hypothetical protein
MLSSTVAPFGAGVVFDLVALAYVIVITPDLGEMSGLERRITAGPIKMGGSNSGSAESAMFSARCSKMAK